MQRRALLWLFLLLLGVYLLVFINISLSFNKNDVLAPEASSFNPVASMPVAAVLPRNLSEPFEIPEAMKGKTLIVGFCNHRFKSVGVTWYQRLTRLGYSTHILVATDQAMVDFLRTKQNFRYQISLHKPMPDFVKSKPKTKQDHLYLELLMAVRWKYLLMQLRNGMHIVLTDVDNIFTRYLDADHEFTAKDPQVDVWHAYATKFPRKAFGKLGFVVCSGMSWWRSSPGAIRLASLMQEKCGDMCDDQRELNNLLASDVLNMTWHWPDMALESLITNATTQDSRYLGLPTKAISGQSDVTGHFARIWDRDFAFRGQVKPPMCPENNWVSMPVLEAKSRHQAWISKLESFRIWDTHCGGE